MEQEITAVTIAQDVLKWLEPDSPVKIVPKMHNSYIVIPLVGDDVDIQAYLQTGKSCEVCGIGALAAAFAFHRDGLIAHPDYNEFDEEANGFVGSREIYTALQPYFDHYQLATIEVYFESTANQSLSAADRLRNICQNIIRNNGVFVREQEAYA
jgi:hypothetical protein